MRIYKDGHFKDIKSINIFKNGEWQKECNAYVYIKGQWMSLIEYRRWIYEEGIEHEPIVEGYAGRYKGTITKEEKMINIRNGILTGRNRVDTIVNESSVDISDYRTLFVEWENVDSRGSGNGISLGVERDTDPRNDVVNFEIKNDFQRHISTVDVKDLMGNFYVKVYGGGNINNSYDIKIYKIWLE